MKVFCNRDICGLLGRDKRVDKVNHTVEFGEVVKVGAVLDECKDQVGSVLLLVGVPGMAVNVPHNDIIALD